jgi:hypothetical protein
MSTSNLEDDYIIVIRSSEERTFEVCRELLERYASPKQVTFVKLSPFKAALEECFRIGINSKKKWLITADADMLVLPGSVDLLVQQAQQMPENYLQLQGKIYDKITGSIRKAGPRIYRIKYLPKVLEYSMNSEDNIRPEGSLVTVLGKQGMPSRYISAVTALHDFEQYYKDLYRKAYVHAIKHQNLAGKLIQRSIENKEQDKDFQVILRAVLDGIEEAGKVSIDVNLFRKKSEQALKLLGIEEKKPLSDSIDPEEILHSIQKNQPLENHGPVYYSDQPSGEKKIGNDFLRILKRDGVINGALHGFGLLLVKVGSKLKNG